MSEELNPMNPEMGHDMPDAGVAPQHTPELSPEDKEQEGKMAKADLYKLASYSHKLFKQLHDEDELEAWVQAKITKAADYIASVYHYLEYEMKFSEYGKHLSDAETLSEGQKMKLRELLAEAKEKTTELKKSQAKKSQAKKVDESMMEPCGHCHGAGHVEKRIPEETKNKVEKYNRLTKAMKAAHTRLDKNGNGVPDALEDNEVEENFDGERGGDQQSDSKFNKQKTSTGTRYTRKTSTFSDEHDGGEGTKSHAKEKSAGEKAADKEKEIKLPKHDKPTWGMKGGEKFGKKEVAEALKGKQKKLDVDKDGDIEADDLADLRAGKKEKKVDEAKPSTGLSAAKKSAVVKKAKAGGDIGKPGKSFDKLAKSAGGGEKGQKIAAAAMWKNIKETTAYIEEKKAAVKKADKDYDGDGKIESGKDEHAGSVDKAIKAAKKETVKESAEVSQFKSNLKRLLG